METIELYRELSRARSLELALGCGLRRMLLEVLGHKEGLGGGQGGHMHMFDHEPFGLSGEVAALVLEAGLSPRYGRVYLRQTLPFSAELERHALPNVARIIEVGTRLMN